MANSAPRSTSTPRHAPSRQRGIAVLVALVILAIAASLSASMLFNRNLDVHRTAAGLHIDQAREYLFGAQDWVKQILEHDAKNSQTDSLGEQWATRIPALPVEGGALTGHVVDMQGRFNLNNLGGDSKQQKSFALQQFQRLLVILKIHPEIAVAVADWIDTNSLPRRPLGAEDGYYTTLSPPYLAGNQPMASVSELLLIKGVSYRDYQKLLPYVVALPASNLPINVNTAPWPVIASLARDIAPGKAKHIVEQRGPDGFKSLSAFQQRLQIEIPTGGVTLSSHFFRLTATARIGSFELTMYSLLKRRKEGDVFCTRRTFGTL